MVCKHDIKDLLWEGISGRIDKDQSQGKMETRVPEGCNSYKLTVQRLVTVGKLLMSLAGKEAYNRR